MYTKIKYLFTVVRKIILFIIGLLRMPFSKSKYHIKKGYYHRKKYTHFSDIENDEQWQKEVYEIAEQIANKNGYKKVLDIGCGSAFKLIKYFGKNFDIIGVEIKDTYQYLVKKYPHYTWLDGETTDYSKLDADMIICSDVIEHVLNPTVFLNQIKEIKKVKKILISTPDRLLARGPFDFGPPANKTHIREWNGKEFYKYMNSQGFRILTYQVTNYSQSTLLVICENETS